jgi:2-polyprenyl-3-methyl-5-hydroxy-6-metoxy-1,4-benzoquinol methylase
MKLYLKVKDHSVSQELFELWQDEDLDMLVTQPQPMLENLDKYYANANYISHTDGNNTLFEKAYQFVKNIALKNKLSLINDLSISKGKILDIGAGVGDFLATAQQNGWETVGVEPNQKARQIAEQKGVSFGEKTEDLPANSFDIITMWHVLEHVPDLEMQLNELKRLVKNNGHIIIAVPNFKSYDAKYYKEFWAAYDVPIHFWHFSKKAINLLFDKHNINLINVLPMKFDAFYVALLSEKYKTGKMNFIKATYIGLKSNFKASKSEEWSSHIYVLKA